MSARVGSGSKTRSTLTSASAAAAMDSNSPAPMPASSAAPSTPESRCHHPFQPAPQNIGPDLAPYVGTRSAACMPEAFDFHRCGGFETLKQQANRIGDTFQHRARHLRRAHGTVEPCKAATCRNVPQRRALALQMRQKDRRRPRRITHRRQSRNFFRGFSPALATTMQPRLRPIASGRHAARCPHSLERR